MQHEAGQVEMCVTVFAALASPDRLRIVRLLTARPHSVKETADALSIAPVNLSHHLTVLREARLVANRRQGRLVFYSLRPGLLPDNRPEAASQETLDLGCCQFVMPTATHGDD